MIGTDMILPGRAKGDPAVMDWGLGSRLHFSLLFIISPFKA